MAGNACAWSSQYPHRPIPPDQSRSVSDPARLLPCFNVLLSELSIEIWTVSPKGHSLSGRKRELHLEAVYGGGFAATRRFEFIPLWGFLVFLPYTHFS
jgi:hypothetical protein